MVHRILLLSVILPTLAYADCDLKKAGRNKILDNKIGLSGRCTTDTALKNELTKKTDSVFNADKQKTTEKIINIKSKTDDLVEKNKKTPFNTIKNIPYPEK